MRAKGAPAPAIIRFDDLPREGFVRQAQLVPDVVPFSAATLWRKVRMGEFPQPVKLGPRVTAWRVGDLRDYFASLTPTQASPGEMEFASWFPARVESTA